MNALSARIPILKTLNQAFVDQRHLAQAPSQQSTASQKSELGRPWQLRPCEPKSVLSCVDLYGPRVVATVCLELDRWSGLLTYILLHSAARSISFRAMSIPAKRCVLHRSIWWNGIRKGSCPTRHWCEKHLMPTASSGVPKNGWPATSGSLIRWRVSFLSVRSLIAAWSDGSAKRLARPWSTTPKTFELRPPNGCWKKVRCLLTTLLQPWVMKTSRSSGGCLNEVLVLHPENTAGCSSPSWRPNVLGIGHWGRRRVKERGEVAMQIADQNPRLWVPPRREGTAILDSAPQSTTDLRISAVTRPRRSLEMRDVTIHQY